MPWRRKLNHSTGATPPTWGWTGKKCHFSIWWVGWIRIDIENRRKLNHWKEATNLSLDIKQFHFLNLLIRWVLKDPKNKLFAKKKRNCKNHATTMHRSENLFFANVENVKFVSCIPPSFSVKQDTTHRNFAVAYGTRTRTRTDLDSYYFFGFYACSWT